MKRAKAGVKYRDLREYLEILESKRLLKRVKTEVDLRHEIGAICAMSLDRRGPALLFENIKGYRGIPLVCNILSTTAQLALVFGAEADEEKIYSRIVHGMENRIPSATQGSGPCKEEIYRGNDIDLYKFPTPVWHELDGGQYVGTTAGCVTKDPKTGIHNMGSYRVMIKDRTTLAANIKGSHPVGERPSSSLRLSGGAVHHILQNEAKGLPTPIALAMGMDPLLTLASGTPVPADDKGQTEYEAAGGWRGAATELVRCETSDLLVPANAEIIIEGEVVANVRTAEGPHGESTGFYGENKEGFQIKVNCITHRKNPISYGLICRVFEDYPRTLLRSGSFQSLLIRKNGLRNIRQAYLPEVGRLGMVIISAKIGDAGEPRRIMRAAWENGGARWVIVVDEDCDVRDWNDVMWRVCSAADPKKDIIEGLARAPRSRMEGEFDPPSCGMGIDATMRFKETKFPPVNEVSRELMSKVVSRWREYRLD
ncbi:MAG: UbiD family decarboxylase [Deltaproteobacteria bacterium]|nr:UbiD family decarboxylase [Deltaproteobacteria bacterium]